ncbi:integral membrane protein of SoxR-reducing complex [Buchnera aphidicola str. Ak (Acyrthosiphon kondoi)]|uniref:Ion-translocating oxidoreductase complex subunit D n=1 Tax=Buchnera aphidicola str. Ak (Acyrthosiphon kondoi) TaxID=1005090 RepID=G2LMJ0_9GAMM|nr:RnfABCDGE type electron transport complex subunit D [Buchnera aphidicola]AEO08478.1 integral membrane protein of SoxR-reducing complex [Buchnera aphidicola str. Ak (Acyrthosiphon kondoi)]WAI18167.1 MAG: RnfABCDGE type electron transport complex subunit D [Buchnera aphidicola (Acyrthosiphon caraganae)]
MNFPCIYHTYSIRKIMFLVIIACIPGLFTKFYFFGGGALIQILFSIFITLLLEISILKMRLKKIKINLRDNSSILTSVLFALSIPVLLPWWIIVIGLFFSIIVAKHLYGGMGQNIFNPAMVGYAVLLISFPIHMNSWNERDFSLSIFDDLKKSSCIIFFKNHTCTISSTNTISNRKLRITPDAFTEATPLDDFKIKSHLRDNFLSKEITLNDKKNNIQTSWKYMNISFFLGGVFLLFTKIICWRIPISFLTSLGVISIITYFYSQELFMSPLVHFLSGGTMICAFFIATDPVTTSCTNIGKIVFGIIIGFLVWIIRNYSDYPDAIAFSVLFANMTAPLMDYYIKTSGYGHNNI